MSEAITAATDAARCRLVRASTQRLVLMAPAVSRPVAEASAETRATLPAEAVSVILDMDPEVYRPGYGDPHPCRPPDRGRCQARIRSDASPGR